jgi:hypothetical protein
MFHLSADFLSVTFTSKLRVIGDIADLFLDRTLYYVNFAFHLAKIRNSKEIPDAKG